MTSFPTPVPKPSTAGTGKTALAKAQATYVNLRNGPGTNYRDIGDIRNNTVLIHYPASRTRDGWEWIEQYSVSGWVSTSVISFQDIAAPAPVPPNQATPYDGKVAVWHWKGDSLAENTIEDVVKNIKAVAPQVNALFVKTSDATPRTGAQWQGYWDTKRALAIDGPQSIDRWVEVLSRYGMEFHAWCVPKGTHLEAETNIIIQVCNRPGVKSMILDVEPYDGFWEGGQAMVRPYMTRIRKGIPGSFHIGMSVDPRKHHYDSITPQEWFPFVNSVHPQDYWATFRRTPEDTLRETFEVWGGYGKPIFPVLQGDANATDMTTAITLATKQHQARGLSWWRLGVINSSGWRSINQPIQPGTTPTPPPPNPPATGEEQVVRPGDSGYAKGTYTGQQEFQEFQGTWGWTVYYKNTEPQTSKVWTRWTPKIQTSGKYEIAAFVPARHATTLNARYKINGVKGSNTELVVNLEQSKYSNTWVVLGVYDLDRATVGAGTVFLNDLTGETGKEIAFDALRWKQIITTTPTPTNPPPTNTWLADGFDSPIGTETERRSSSVWPGAWIDASPFAKLYFVGTPQEAYHTGADLNLPRDADAHTPIYSSASGVVVFASRLPVWGNVIIIKHDPLTSNGRVYYTRYGHVEDMIVKVGDRVRRGQQIAKVGNAFGAYAYHLHFDISPTTLLETQPQHWPARNLNNLLANYVDPRQFILNNRPK
jgi:murein DD-endopeptidase MepM/ murein hydrolase activator NlpD